MAETKTDQIKIRVKTSVKQAVQSAAEAKGMTVSEWLMELIKKAVRK